ncbi:antibiotic biosynthesis monooxygenase (ABM) superfamily enzyme [Alkalibacillus flavidus]|uniref:Antibiotic biosynthesis monooxygenase (ABM) superfamily enzyme n=1 Tax=Alkalibacillus flavidus TaxID=546021 RepID=A0ABV2KUR5_9BACI
MSKQGWANVILVITLVIVTTMYIMETAETTTTHEWLEDLTVEDAKFESSVDRDAKTMLREYVRTNEFRFDNTITIYDQTGEEVAYEIQFRYNDDDELIVTSVDRFLDE